MVIGLMGFPFVDSNKGCEALAYSFVSVLSKTIADSITIINFSGGGIGDIETLYPNIKFESVDFKRKQLYIPALKKLKKCDFVFDCTYGDNFSDLYDLNFVKKTTRFKELVLWFKKPLVLAPQTIGPFSNEKIKKRAINIIKKSKKIYSRDKITTEYIRNISGITVDTVTDLAFLLPYYKEKYRFNTDKTKIGLNVSGLLWKGGFLNKNQFNLKLDYQELTRKVILWLISQNYEIHLIPHVIATENLSHDDDMHICESLAKDYGIICAPKFTDPISAKSYIANMDMFIGARMHSTIAAFSSGIPTIPISYSRKFEGLYNSLNYNFVVNARKLDLNSALGLIEKYVNEKELLGIIQKEALQIIEKLEDVYIKSMEDLMKMRGK